MSSPSMLVTPPEQPEGWREFLTDFRQQYVAATGRQEELLKLMLHVQKDFRSDCAAVATRQEAMLAKLLDNQTSSLRQQDPSFEVGKLTGCTVPQPNLLEPNRTVGSGPLKEVTICRSQQDIAPDGLGQQPSYRALSNESLATVRPAQQDAALDGAAQQLKSRDWSRSDTSVSLHKRPDRTISHLQKHLGSQSFGFEDKGETKTIVRNPYFIGGIYIVILTNALGMGIQVDLYGGSWDILWEVLDYVFTAIFIVEAIAKLYCLRVEYFKNTWNLVDFCIVCSAIADFFTQGRNFTLLKMLRLGRLVRILEMNKDLTILIGGIIASLRAMFWVCVLMALIIYAGAILCVDVMRDVDAYQSYGLDTNKHFGNLGSSMLTLFGIAILDVWSDVVWPVSRVQPFMLPFFGFFLVITCFALMNAFIGIVVDRITTHAKEAEEQQGRAKRGHKLEIAYELVALVENTEDSCDGFITVEELEKIKHTEIFKSMTDQLDFPPGFSLSDLHLILDENGNGEMSGEEFIDGMFRLIFCCTDFHHQCVTMLQFAQIKGDIFKLRRDVFKEMKTMSRDVFKDIKPMRVEPVHAESEPKLARREKSQQREHSQPSGKVHDNSKMVL